MATRKIIALWLLIFPVISALRAMPDSSCATLCLDSNAKNSSDVSAYTTVESDLMCSDNEFGGTTAGKKFEKCNECLLNSTAEADGFTDQGAVLYNLRATVDHCLWGFPNASTPISSPCSTDFACQPLRGALTFDNLNPNNTNTSAYCTADNGAFLGENLAPCIACFQATEDQTYLANFLVALQANCQPNTSTLITPLGLSLDGPIFDSTPVNITNPTAPIPLTAPSSSPSGMKSGTTVGIVFAVVILAVALAAFGTTLIRRRLAQQTQEAHLLRKTSCDSRHGSSEISAPYLGGFAQPQSWNTPYQTQQQSHYRSESQMSSSAYGSGAQDHNYGVAGGMPPQTYAASSQQQQRPQSTTIQEAAKEDAIPRGVYTAAWLATKSRSDVAPAEANSGKGTGQKRMRMIPPPPAHPPPIRGIEDDGYRVPAPPKSILKTASSGASSTGKGKEKERASRLGLNLVTSGLPGLPASSGAERFVTGSRPPNRKLMPKTPAGSWS